jgi:hypothetical protein
MRITIGVEIFGIAVGLLASTAVSRHALKPTDKQALGFPGGALDAIRI